MTYLNYSAALAAAGLLTAGTKADFAPIPLATDSFNHDVVVERGALHAPARATTASMDEGIRNTAFGWYEAGYNQDAPDTGFPAAGSTITSEFAPDHSYTLAPSYTANNALLVDTNLPSGTLVLSTPASLATISLLTASGRGPVTNTIVIHYANGSTETNTFVAPDWFGADAAVSANGRVDVGTLGFDNVSSGNPNLYGQDIALTGSGSPVASIEVRNGAAGNAHTAIFAVSGAATAGDAVTPLAVTGFNQDMVVEATAPQPLTELNATTASMDAGTANTGFSWYERGYNTNAEPAGAVTSGLPAAGSTLTNSTSPDHLYALPGNYTAPNGLLVDIENSGTLRFSTPASYSTLSFLTSSGNGPVTISYTANHQDGSTETGTFISPDWFGNPNAALIASGRVNVQSGAMDTVGSDNPRLYSVDITLSNTNSPVTSVDLALSEGTGHAVVFGVSGASGSVAPLVATQPASVRVAEGSSVQLTAAVSGSLPLAYTWQVERNGAFADLQNGSGISGVNTTTLTLDNATFDTEARYRLAVTNASGSALSVPATVAVLSSTPSVLSADDTVEAAGGTSPAAETVEHVVDQDTAKYLNFGADGDQVPPYTGPAGFIVTPVLGSDAAGTIVTALRVFTANDAPERDPASYTLEGSSDGANFSSIASGPLALPDDRNSAGQAIDALTQTVQEVRFANATPYKTYRVLFPTVKNAASANSFQVAEVQLLGTVATEAATRLSIARNADGTLTLASTGAGTLQSTTALGTAWTDEGPINGSVTVSAAGQAKFYRVIAQQ